jgi:hypothetical protein
LEKSVEKDNDTLIVIQTPEDEVSDETTSGKIKRVKNLLSSNSSTIELYDFLIDEVRRFIATTSDDNFKAQGHVSREELLDQISRYEELCNDFSMLTACVAFWARPEHKVILQKILARATDRLDSQSSSNVWIAFRWYPLIVAFYCTGIASVEGKRYDSLANIFYALMGSSKYRPREEYFVEAIANGILELNRIESFKRLPGHEKYYVPMSEHLFKIIQPKLDDLFFIGRNYERVFDEFEVLFALAASDLNQKRGNRIWGPIGRYGWKHSVRENSPLKRIIKEAGEMGDRWEPIRAGLFGGNVERFNSFANEFEQIIAKLNWW